MPSKSFSPGDAFTGSSLFYDGGSGTAVLLQRTGDKMREREKHFATPQAALKWCIARRHNFVFVAANSGAVSRN